MHPTEGYAPCRSRRAGWGCAAAQNWQPDFEESPLTGGLSSNLEQAVPAEQRPVNELAALREAALYSWVSIVPQHPARPVLCLQVTMQSSCALGSDQYGMLVMSRLRIACTEPAHGQCMSQQHVPAPPGERPWGPFHMTLGPAGWILPT